MRESKVRHGLLATWLVLDLLRFVPSSIENSRPQRVHYRDGVVKDGDTTLQRDPVDCLLATDDDGIGCKDNFLERPSTVMPVSF